MSLQQVFCRQHGAEVVHVSSNTSIRLLGSGHPSISGWNALKRARVHVMVMT